MHTLINGWFAGQLTTGSGQYLHHLLAHLAHAAVDHRYTLLTPPGVTEAAEWPGVTVVERRLPPLPRQPAKLWWEQVAVPRAARALGADVLWVPYWAAPYWQPTPTVVTVHDVSPRLLPAYRGGAAQRLYTRLVSASARRAEAVITVSDAAARDIVATLGVPPARVFAVHHGPNRQDPDALQPARLDDVRRRYALPARYFLYLGGFDVRKNVAQILHAYRRYLDKGGDPAVKLVIAGKLPSEKNTFTPDPRTLAAELALLDALHFCGWVPDEDKPALYHMATGFLFPSLYEGFGMPVLEAMQAGAPVITSGEGGAQRIGF